MFDLNLLFARPDAPAALSDVEKASLDRAVENAMAIGFDEYSSQVVAYLEPELAELHASPDAWSTMQEAVVARIEALR